MHLVGAVAKVTSLASGRSPLPRGVGETNLTDLNNKNTDLTEHTYAKALTPLSAFFFV